MRSSIDDAYEMIPRADSNGSSSDDLKKTVLSRKVNKSFMEKRQLSKADKNVYGSQQIDYIPST